MNPDLITDPAKYERGWKGGLPETPCGFGSRLRETAVQREWIPRMVAKYGIRTISDIGAGDLNWIKQVEWPYPVKYKAFDLVPRHHTVTQFDIIKDYPFPVDLVMCLWVLNHLPEDDARQALKNLTGAGSTARSTYLMITYESRQWDFTDLPAIDSVVIRRRNDKRGNVEIRLIHNNPIL